MAKKTDTAQHHLVLGFFSVLHDEGRNAVWMDIMPSSRRWVGCIVAVFATVAVAAGRYAFDREFGAAPHFLLPFVLPVLVAAWFGGFGPGLFATGLNAAVVASLFDGPGRGLDSGDVADRVRVGVLLGVGLFVSVICGHFHRDRQRAEAAAAQVARRQDELRSEITVRQEAERRLTASELLLRLVTDQVPVMLVHCDRNQRYTFVNRTFADQFGAAPNEIAGKTVPEVLGPTGYDRIKDQMAAALAGETVEFEADIPYHRTGLRRVHCTYRPEVGAGGRIDGFVATISDITERKRGEEALRLSEARKAAILETALDCVITMDHEGNVVEFNTAAEGTFGYSRAEVVGKELAHFIIPPAHRERHRVGMAHYLATGEGPVMNRRLELPALRADGTEFPAELAITRIPTGGPPLFTAYLRDITDRKRDEERVLASLREKEVLLKEIHHRVKNNLQIVSALLDLQSEHTSDPAVLTMFKESRGRVKSMAMIHERLYRSQDMARVNFTEYVRQLADDLYRTYKVSDNDIRLELDVDIPPLTIDIAIPCGLLLNELMSNCFKHAFKDVTEGCIRVSLHRAGDDTNVLSVADDGAGFPAGTDFRNTTSFGMQLVNTLVDQLDGEIELTTGRGTTVTARFPKPKK